MSLCLIALESDVNLPDLAAALIVSCGVLLVRSHSQRIHIVLNTVGCSDSALNHS